MIFRFVTGKLGSGKTLCAVADALKYLKRGSMMATNVDIFPEHFHDKHNDKTRIYRLPDHPTAEDLKMLPVGNPTLEIGPDGSYMPSDNYDPNANSILLLDELAQFLNTRNFQAKGRLDLIGVLVLLRKMGWDAYFLVQHIDMVDKQVREALSQETGFAKNLSRFPVPVLGPLTRMIFGKAVTLGAFGFNHRISFHDGHSKEGVKIETRSFTAGPIKKIYNTAQLLHSDYSPMWAKNHHENAGLHCLLTPYHLAGYCLPKPVPIFEKIKRVISVIPFYVALPFVALIPNEKLWSYGG